MESKHRGLIYNVFVLYCIVVFVYNSGYYMMTTDASIGSYLMLSLALIFFVVGLKHKLYNRTLTFKFFMGFTVMLLVTMTFNIEFSGVLSYYTYWAQYLISFVIVNAISSNNFVKYYVNTMRVIAAIALISYYAVLFFGLTLNLPLIENSNERMMYDGILFFYPQYGYERNQGLFWEPGLLATHLIFAIILEILFSKKIKIWSIVLFIWCIITTYSAAAYAILPLLLILFIYSKKQNNAVGMTGVILIIIMFFYVLLKDDILNVLNEKLPIVFNKFVSENESQSERYYVPMLNMGIFLLSPIIGVGLRKFATLFAEYDVAQTSTNTAMLAQFGILGIIYTAAWCIGVFSMKRFNIMTRTILFIIIMLILNKENHYGLLATNCLMFFFLKVGEEKEIV